MKKKKIENSVATTCCLVKMLAIIQVAFTWIGFILRKLKNLRSSIIKNIQQFALPFFQLTLPLLKRVSAFNSENTG